MAPKALTPTSGEAAGSKSHPLQFAGKDAETPTGSQQNQKLLCCFMAHSMSGNSMVKRRWLTMSV